MTGATSRLERAPDALFRYAGEEVLLARVGSADVDVLNHSAAAIWAVLELPRSLPEIVDQLSDAYEIPREKIEHDVRSVVEQLVRREWIRSRDG